MRVTPSLTHLILAWELKKKPKKTSRKYHLKILTHFGLWSVSNFPFSVLTSKVLISTAQHAPYVPSKTTLHKLFGTKKGSVCVCVLELSGAWWWHCCYRPPVPSASHSVIVFLRLAWRTPLLPYLHILVQKALSWCLSVPQIGDSTDKCCIP